MYCAENGKKKQVRCEGIDLGEGMMIEETNQERYKYYRREDVCQDDLKRMVKKEYFKQVRAVLKSSLCFKRMGCSSS